MKPDAFVLRGLLVARLCVFAPPTPALAAGVVGTGTPTSCTEAALNTTLAGGGSITFNCGGTAQINFTSAKSITVSTTLDGGGVITLSGQDATRLFVVSNAAVLTLRNIALTDGYSADNGGAIYNGALGSDTPGAVVLENSQIGSSRSGQSGGAIVSTGPLTITNSVFVANVALNGGALYPRFAGARVSISNSIFDQNAATDTTNGWGGAILAWDGASVTIQESQFINNTAHDGGGIYGYANSSVTLLRALFRANGVVSKGGGLANFGRTAITDTTFIDNSAGGGGDLFNESLANLKNVVFSSNAASYGGGVMNFASSANPFIALDGATFNGNTGDFGGALYNAGTASVANATFSDNSARRGGGVYNELGTGSLAHTTFVANTAGINGGAMFAKSGAISVSKSIVADSPSGGNCSGAISNAGFNLSTDATCLGFNQIVNIGLGPLADNGGSMWTHLPLSGSPAIDFVAIGCPPPATDQRGFARSMDGDGDGTARCDSGAVERQAAGPELLLRLFLSALSR